MKLMLRKREYSGQPHTDYGERGKRLVEGLTMRDICDCYVRGVFLSASHVDPDLYAEADKGEDAELTTNDLFKISYDRIDPMAICQNMMCEVERMMGIFPNIPITITDGEGEETLQEKRERQLDEYDPIADHEAQQQADEESP